MKMIKFPSIEQYRNIVKNIKDMTAYEGKDENGNTIFNYDKEMPTLKFTGTTKLHGTNAGVSYDTSTGEIWFQSRENIITPEKDNAGFAFFANSIKEELINFFNFLKSEFNIEDSVISIFGEWAGPGIQKAVGISKIKEKSFFIFDIKVTPNDIENNKVKWLNLEDIQRLDVDRVFYITGFTTYEVEIDFNHPELVQNKLIELTDAVEHDCPVAKQLGVSEDNIGEGIVWRIEIGDDVLRFKVKGEKHSSSKVKTVAAVDIEKVNSINEFIEYAVTENRLLQGIEQVFTSKGEVPDIKKMGDYIKWVSSDVIKEESDTMAENGLEPKNIGGALSTKARKFFMKYLDENM
jgi:RNA ligase